MKTTSRLLCLLFAVLLASPALALNATWNAATDIPVTAASYAASGTVNFTLNFAPATGTNLKVVNNTGLGFISGTFSNLAQGQAVALSFASITYNFVANYYGGTGNDLVLMWANCRPMAWGSNVAGKLGYGTDGTADFNPHPLPVAVSTSGVLSNKTVIAVAGGGGHSLAVCADGTLAAWGGNGQGQLGNNSTTDSALPIDLTHSGVLSTKTVVAVAAGQGFSLALCSDGSVAAWGDNSHGQLGNNSITNSSVPVAVNTTGVLLNKKVVAIAAGGHHSLALCSDGTLAAWGWNTAGQLGDNNGTVDSSVPVAVDRTGVLSTKSVVALAGGFYHSLALCSDGTVAAWGNSSYGQLGNGSVAPVNTSPTAVSTAGILLGKTVTAITAGDGHCLALCSDGTLAAWGRNNNGQLGNNSTADSSVPLDVTHAGALSTRTVTAVAAGSFHSFALCSDGSLATWGANNFGQLGNGSTTQGLVPGTVSIATLVAGERFVLTNAGPQANHSLANIAVPLPIPDIRVEQPVGTIIISGGTKSFGTILQGGTASLTFTISNFGNVNLTGLTITKDGTNAADFSVSASPTAPVSPGGNTTFTVQFAPAAGGAVTLNETAAFHIANNVPGKNPFDINLTGTALSYTQSTGNDGMSDAAKFLLAPLGFNWQLSQPALVNTLYTNANAANLYTQAQFNANRTAGQNDVINSPGTYNLYTLSQYNANRTAGQNDVTGSPGTYGLYSASQYAANRTAGQNDVINSPNTYSLYTLSQVQSLNAGTPLLTKDAGTGKFKLTIGIQKSPDLATTPFAAFPFTAPDMTINAQGKIEFLFTVPGNAAFFRVQAQ